MRRLNLLLGCHRSGTSLLSRAIGAVHEPWFPFMNVGALHADGARTATMTNPNHVVSPYGISCRIDRLRREYNIDQVHTLWLVRHPLDTCLSLLPIFEHGWDVAVRAPADSTCATPESRAALLWNTTQNLGSAHAENGSDVITTIRYEDCIATPHTAMRTLESRGFTCDHRWPGQVTEIHGEGEIPGQAWWALRQTAHSRRVGRWREAPPDLLRELCALIDWDVAGRFGYHCPTSEV